MGTEEQRLARVRATMAVAKVCKAWKEEALLGRVGEAVEKALGEERSVVVQGKWRECLALVR